MPVTQLKTVTAPSAGVIRGPHTVRYMQMPVAQPSKKTLLNFALPEACDLDLFSGPSTEVMRRDRAAVL